MNNIIKFLFENSQNITYLASSIGILFVGIELGLKFRAEKRLKKASEIESQIKLLKLFTETMDIAEARRKTVLSKELLNHLIENNDIDDFLDKKANAKSPFLDFPIGKASQLSCISSIYELARKHEILREPAKEALCGFQRFNDPEIKSLSKEYSEHLYEDDKQVNISFPRIFLRKR